MDIPICLVLIASLGARVDHPTQLPASKVTREIDSLIDKLQEVSKFGIGYSTVSTGGEFLPQPDSKQTFAFQIADIVEDSSPILRGIVEKGVAAIPLLIQHLGDERKTAIPPVKALEWMSFADEFDFNRRTRLKAPNGVNRDTFGEKHPNNHQITVGDLCFVAIGQIVNRDFSCCRYQPSGGLVISSPTYSKPLRNQVTQDFNGLTEEKHKNLLIQDFLRSDQEFRRIGAYRRLAFYYPSEVENLVLKQLSLPAYDPLDTQAFVRTKLYAEKSKVRRKELFEKSIRERGPAWSDGIRLELFDDLDIQEADEQKLVSRPGHPGDARTLLMELYGYKNTVRSTDKPHIESSSTTELARFIKCLLHDKCKTIDERVFDIFRQIRDDDFLALACMARLVGRGYEKDIRGYCERRVGKDEFYEKELLAVLKRLDSPGKGP